MKAIFKKEIIEDPQDKKQNYENCTLDKDTEFCCEKLKAHCKKFTGWDYNKGKFAIVESITYEGHSTVSIDFCPFCGEKIEYQERIMSSRSNKKWVPILSK